MAAKDQFAEVQPSLLSSSTTFDMITPNDNTDLVNVTREITVGTPGALTVVRYPDGAVITIPTEVWSVQPVQSIRVSRIKATGTTADKILVK